VIRDVIVSISDGVALRIRTSQLPGTLRAKWGINVAKDLDYDKLEEFYNETVKVLG